MQIWVKREEVRVGDVIVGYREDHDSFDTFLQDRKIRVDGVKADGFVGSCKNAKYVERYNLKEYKHTNTFLVDREEVVSERKIESASDVWARVDKKGRPNKTYDLKKVVAQIHAEPPTTPGSFDQLVSRQKRTYDGLTQVECFERYCANMREFQKPKHNLTARQREAAQAMWSSQLKQKLAASQQKEKNRVLVDLDVDIDD